MTTPRFVAALAATLSLCSPAAQAADFTVTSKAFASGTVQPPQFANIMGCTGENLSPDIQWSNAPEGTRSFVVTIYDKDAPTGSGWWHWVVVDLPAGATSLAAGAGSGKAALPAGARMTPTDMGTPGFLGACPPQGPEHDYTITVKALGIDKLPVPDNATPAMVGFVSTMNALATATLSAKGRR
ncbi:MULTISPECIES: YbhB/YbcL family Raf kinase inhibitor-like protein [unclassified Shinella]|uniref:YbhB/YbcL family Raf kinase inhibitor-like protein n=1 Tax=unclassified Shinella TaxID=2643062 RepID=UPI00234F1C93|nr:MULTISPECIES: YbhB/YbcL family Raf kinase inhibitor-like protein [unclassified Shinella]MCO5150961.1 YbhB/YbcL family Raf kinase inhibitor-like protein [Shinella sp.]MDC7263028.1 YbhB/YbcL family Raf kinase inhibitor-like protein [Shinella sp. HY16]MDC7269923.1 YbhB/YbcL family Raf kinase inhibitor-like protein [Shinella sp. YZ44]